MLWWDEGLCRTLSGAGRFVIRYDHRDTGRSITYRPGHPGYIAADLLADAAGVLDAYGIASAHVVGVSAGGPLRACHLGEGSWDTQSVSSPRFSLRQLAYFLAAADAGSVTEAAQNIPVAPSSVSAAIAQLEAALGVQLVIRHHAQGISPTAEGRQFLERARALLRNVDELESFASELAVELSGTLHLGCLVTLAPLTMPRLGKGFRERHPAVALKMVEAGQQELIASLRAGRLSLILTYDLDLGDDLAFTPLVDLPPYAVFADDHPLAGADSVTMAELAAEPLVLLDLPHSREYFRSLFVSAGVAPEVAYRSVHPDVVRTMVANSFGYSIINARPRIDTALDGMPLRTVPIGGRPRPMILGLVRLKRVRPTRLVKAFEQHCRAAIASGAVPGVDGGA